MLAISDALNEARLAAVLSFLDTGSGNARLRIYSGARPAAGAAPAGTLLVEIALAKPAGTVSGGLLTLATASPTTMVTVGGTATWARLVNGAGTWVFDCDVTVTGGGGEVELASVVLFAGGLAAITSAILG